ncbi:oxygenase MpaB family protein [Aquihabitans sp. McL0605]|uniref:oxygenase MpaB family protein n=1 Tax=Aquihabitans sp. McL0605 TaxID=3415671 RepID=UPI003CE9C9EC
MAPAAKATSDTPPPARPARTAGIHPAAARMWRPEPEWVPATASSAELVGGITGGVFGALAAPVIARPILRAMSALGPGPGSRPVDAAEMGDPGWFGPTSVAWRVHSDPSLLVAGIAAFTLQALHPLAMAGVAEHSAFSDDFLGRTRRTAEFVQGVVYGSSARAERLCRMVRKVHEPVVGVAPDGRPYAANDPDLLDWVHIAEYLAIASANRRFSLHPMTRDELDQYIAEVARVGEATGVEHPPRSWAEILEALERHRPNLAVGEYAAAGIGFLNDPPILPAASKPVWRSLWGGARASLPPVAHRLLNLPEPSTAELIGCRATLRLLSNLSSGDGPELSAAKVRLGITG